MLSDEIIDGINERLEIQKSLNSDFILQLNKIDNKNNEMMDEIMINIEDIFSIMDVINRNNKRISDKMSLEFESHKIVINDLSTKLDKFKITTNMINLNNDTNKNILRVMMDRIDKIEKIKRNDHYYFIINFFIGVIVIYINFLYIYIK